MPKTTLFAWCGAAEMPNTALVALPWTAETPLTTTCLSISRISSEMSSNFPGSPLRFRVARSPWSRLPNPLWIRSPSNHRS